MTNYNIKIKNIEISENNIYIEWSANIGFGVLNVHYDKEKDTYLVETETLGKDFYQQVLEEAKEYILYKSVIID